MRAARLTSGFGEPTLSAAAPSTFPFGYLNLPCASSASSVSSTRRLARERLRRQRERCGKPDDPYTNEGETQTFTVNADGSYTKLDSMTLHVNNEAGVARAAQQYIWFNRNMADVQILEAYTTGADGVRHDVQPDQIRDVQEARSFDAPMFQDIQEKVIVFPAVEPGSRVHLTYRKTQKVADRSRANSAISRRPISRRPTTSA